jgi:hypothetical protein
MRPTSRSPKQHPQTETDSSTAPHYSPHHGSHHGPHVSEYQLQLLDDLADADDTDIGTDQWILDPATRCVGLAGVKEARQYLTVKAKLPISKAS